VIRPFVQIANRYARDVVAGKIPACSYVVAACRRHLDDLERSKSPSFRFRFNAAAARARCVFIEQMRHVKGKWARKPIHLEPFQVFIVCMIFGWVVKKTGLRRFIQVYLELARKNAKSTLAAAIAHAMFTLDDEAGAEVYSGATTEKQAWEVFGPARLMARNNPEYREHYGIEVNAKSLTIPESGAKFEPIIGNPGDGSSPHLAIHDEFHEHRTSEQVDAMQTGMGARQQPLQFIITTAGVNLSGPCYEMRRHVINVLEGKAEDDGLFAMIFTIDREDDWKDFAVWRKANPNLGVSVNEDYLAAQHRAALSRVDKRNIILCKHLNLWMTTNTAFFDMLAWRKCARAMRFEEFHGRRCFSMMDLASRVDIAAIVWIFPAGGEFDIFQRFYLPEETVMLAQNEHYRTWREQGHITVTPGASIDFDRIEEDFKETAKHIELVHHGYDPFQATQMVGHLEDAGITCVEVGATVRNFSDPMKALYAATISRKIRHDGNPVMEWMVSNVVAHYDAKGNVYPRKEAEANKIDGAVATIGGLSLALRHTDESSVYDTSEVKEL
jgi:phage terminase large subunit-like protein